MEDVDQAGGPERRPLTEAGYERRRRLELQDREGGQSEPGPPSREMANGRRVHLVRPKGHKVLRRKVSASDFYWTETQRLENAVPSGADRDVGAV